MSACPSALAFGWPDDGSCRRQDRRAKLLRVRNCGARSVVSVDLRSPAASKMKKNYVLDTNILLHDPHAIFRFDDNNVIIPIYVIEEVDQFKREGSERG